MRFVFIGLFFLSFNINAQNDELYIHDGGMAAKGVPIPRAGLPVIDIAGFAQFAQEALVAAKQFKERMDSIRTQISEAKNQVNEMKKQGSYYKNMVEGHWNIENIFTNTEASKYLAKSEWKGIYTDIGDIIDLRNEFGLKSDNAVIQGKYDLMLRQYSFQEKTYQLSVKRQKRIVDLMGHFESANTPSKKADLLNSLQVERVQMVNDNKMMSDLDNLMRRQSEIEKKVRINKQTELLLRDDF